MFSPFPSSGKVSEHKGKKICPVKKTPKNLLLTLSLVCWSKELPENLLDQGIFLYLCAVFSSLSFYIFPESHQLHVDFQLISLALAAATGAQSSQSYIPGLLSACVCLFNLFQIVLAADPFIPKTLSQNKYMAGVSKQLLCQVSNY